MREMNEIFHSIDSASSEAQEQRTAALLEVMIDIRDVLREVCSMYVGETKAKQYMRRKDA